MLNAGKGSIMMCAKAARSHLKLPAVGRCAFLCLATMLCSAAMTFGQAEEFQPNPLAGPGSIIVRSKFGGQILGFDVDQNGSEGLLSEYVTLSSGTILASVETFDQTS